MDDFELLDNTLNIVDQIDSSASIQGVTERTSLLGKDFQMGSKNEIIELEKINNQIFETEPLVEEEEKRNGSLIGTIFNFTNVPMGAGMLSFPYTYYCSGLVFGICLSVFVIILVFLTLYILIDLNQNYHRKLERMVDIARTRGDKNPLNEDQMNVLRKLKPGGFRSYQQCVGFYLGPIWERICQAVLLFYSTGSLVVYFVVIGQFIKPVVDSWIPNPSEFYHNQKLITVIFSCAVVFPLLMTRSISKLWFTSFLAIISTILLAIFIFVTGLIVVIGRNTGPGQRELFWMQTRSGEVLDLPLVFVAIPIKLFGYFCHILMFPVLYAMKPGSRKKYSFVVIVSISVVFCIYMTTGLFGWFAFGTNVQDNILNNFSGKNWFANIIRLACGINLLFSFPVQNFAARLALLSIIFGSDAEKKRLGTISHVVISLTYFLVNLLCSLFIPHLSILFGFIGAVGAVSLMFFFPAVLVWSELTIVYGRGSLVWKLVYYGISIFLFLVTAFFGISGLLASTFNLITAFSDGTW